jgi:hypothetical protein
MGLLRLSLIALAGTVGAICVGAGLSAQTPPAASASASSKAPVPVVIELFTSEGCSSCPPADDVLTALVREQPVRGVQIIGLGEHVDYWDRLGWRDQFSSALFTARQNDYAQRAFHADSIYTPQLIVNGETQVVGSDAKKVKQAIAKAAERPASVTLALTFPNGAPNDDKRPAKIPVQVQATVAAGAKLDEPTDVLVAVTEEGLGSRVLRGENSGRELRHGSVLRTLEPVGTLALKDSSWSATHAVAVGKEWNPRQIRLVAIAQGQNSRRIVGAALVALP